jgi:hypothetical protein
MSFPSLLIPTLKVKNFIIMKIITHAPEPARERLFLAERFNYGEVKHEYAQSKINCSINFWFNYV